MIFLKRRALMTRASFNYKTVNGIESITLENCVETRFKRLELLGNSKQGENPSIESPKEIKNSGKYDEISGKYLLDVEVKKYEKVSLEKGSLQWGSGEEIVHNGTRSDFVDISGMNKNFVFLVSPKHTLTMNLFFYTENKKYMNVVGIQPEKYYEKCSQYSYRNAPDGARYIRVSLNMYTYNENNEILIEEGSQSQTLTIPLDEPLRGIGEYKDIVTKKGVLRNVLEGNISDNLQNIIYGQPGEKYIFSSFKKADLRYDRTRCMSNVGLTHNQSETRVMYVPVPYQSDFLIKVADDDTVETVREKTKNVTVAYVTKTPIFEPFPQETQLALENLHTNDGTTVITVDSGEVETGIEVEYAVKS